ncbi:uncharacterized protein LOC125777638 [Bactrocera dorsalis]|uniref:Uncharacterized protein LOC125777638 n=1 Tax=Bactrocera dorsalis TaxID=27457 RepID=A0ABM3JHG8_BACDO|nr:uncharacterized protein LOC125777638 [Bactrocera dorsalis]
MSFLKRKSEAILRKLNSTPLGMEELNSMDHAELSVRSEQLDRIQHQFELTQSQLEEEDPDELETTTRDEFAATFIRVKAAFTRELNKLDPQVMSSTRHQPLQEQPSVIVMKQPKSRLPQLQLPSFGGAYTDWPNFFGMFQTIVHDDTELSNLEKFQHLRSCLKGAALDTIQSLEMRDENYTIAMKLLSQRFSNRRLIFQAHIQELFGLQRVSTDKKSGELRSLVDKLVSHVRALHSLGTFEQIADCLLQYIAAQKLDPETHALWEEKVPVDELPTWTDMTTFLQRRCQTLENVTHAMVTKTPSTQVSNTKYRKNAFVVSKTSTKSCSICQKHDHIVYTCPLFASLSPSDRWKEAKRAHLCINCLKPGHQVQQCKSSTCRCYSMKHHTLLHFTQVHQAVTGILETTPGPSQPAVLVTRTSKSRSPSPLSRSCSTECVLLATAIVFVRNSVGSLIPCRAILDSASQLNFITTRLANQLQIKKSKSSLAVSGIGDSEFIVNSSVNISIHSVHNSFSVNLESAVTPTITDYQPNYPLEVSDWDIPANINLADPEFQKPQRVDLLIGASIFFDLLCIGQIRLKNNYILQKTRFGWIVSGGQSTSPKLSSLTTTVTTSLECDAGHPSTNELVRSFWEIDNSFEPISKATREELDCEDHFKANYSRLLTGEYSVRLPLKPSISLLGDSYEQALRRFLTLERRLERNKEVKLQYISFMKEYLELKHMSPVSKPIPSLPTYFIPHHCVFKNDSTTTKLRVVFDGSAQTTTGYSLNNALMAGPTIQPKLADTLLRFRANPVALTGDICKMYRCIRVTTPDNYLQCILWRDDPKDDIKIFKLDTVTYGTKSAPFLAIRTMHQLAVDEAVLYPIGSKIIQRDFYVDDLITGAHTVEEVKEIMKQTSDLLGKGNFKIRKWCSNKPEVLSNVPDTDKEKLIKFDDGSVLTKTLGLQWNPDADIFIFSFTSRQNNTKITKRSVLSVIAQLYDPLGLIGPVVCKAKIFLQRLWVEKIDWDESLPMTYQTAWLQLYDEFSSIGNMTFPRYVGFPNSSLELHAFCDASLLAYGICIYVVSRLGGHAYSTLLCSKSRVAPLKTVTVPKLELCAAALLAQVIQSIYNLRIFNCRFFCWSDSTTVLSWIKEEPSRFNIFVANRITSIQHLTNGMEWRIYMPDPKLYLLQFDNNIGPWEAKRWSTTNVFTRTKPFNNKHQSTEQLAANTIHATDLLEEVEFRIFITVATTFTMAIPKEQYPNWNSCPYQG